MAAVIENPTEVKTDSEEILRPRRFTVEEYHRMIDAEILDGDEQVELIEGEILPMAAKSIKHVAGVRRVGKCLSKYLGERVFIAAQDPIHLDDASEPEPDVIVAVLSETEYEDHHPTPSELLLVVEVAETSFARDRNRKALLYAQAGIIQYCILNLRDHEVEDYREPGPSGYRRKQTYTADQSFNLVAFPEIQISIAELLPRR